MSTVQKVVVVDDVTYNVVVDYDLGDSEASFEIYKDNINVTKEIVQLSTKQEEQMTDDEWNNNGDRKLLINRIRAEFDK